MQNRTVSGSCVCGAVRFESDASPVFMLNCHCRDCQRTNGSGYAAIMGLPRSAVTVYGEPRFFSVVGGSGNAVERGFCAACGSQVIIKIARSPHLIGLQAGCLDDPSIYRPTKDLFVDSAQPWDWLDPALSKDRQEGSVVQVRGSNAGDM